MKVGASKRKGGEVRRRQKGIQVLSQSTQLQKSPLRHLVSPIQNQTTTKTDDILKFISQQNKPQQSQAYLFNRIKQNLQNKQKPKQNKSLKQKTPSKPSPDLLFVQKVAMHPLKSDPKQRQLANRILQDIPVKSLLALDEAPAVFAFLLKENKVRRDEKCGCCCDKATTHQTVHRRAQGQPNEEAETVNQSKIKKSVQTYKSGIDSSHQPLLQQLLQKQYEIDSQKMNIIKLTDIYKKMSSQYKKLEEKYTQLQGQAGRAGLLVDHRRVPRPSLP